jgi:hypothetical protein
MSLPRDIPAIPAAIPPRPPAPVAAPDGLTEEVEPDEEVDPEEEMEVAESVPDEAAPVVSSGAAWTVPRTSRYEDFRLWWLAYRCHSHVCKRGNAREDVGVPRNER